MDSALVAALEQHLESDADSEKRPAACGVQHSRPQSPRIHLPHALGHRALPRKNHAVCLGDARGIGGHFDARLGRDVLHRLGDRVEIAHSVVDDGDAHCGPTGA
jgi:hypothetical protein